MSRIQTKNENKNKHKQIEIADRPRIFRVASQQRPI